jgi:glycosyltransferase involved in cell wall biosynthesis
MSDQPLVSIIIPTYNRAHLIAETLDSIVAQTYENWECIIVDDGSSDTTVAHVHKNYPAVKLFKENQNLGFGQANNKGISYALNQGAEHVFSSIKMLIY